MRSSPLRSILAAGAFAVGAAACGDPFAGVTGEPAPASAKVDQLAVALTTRFTNVDRSGRFEAARHRLILGALTPGKLFGDSTMWTTATPPATRTMVARGSLIGGAYRFEFAPGPAAPLMLGDTRHLMALTRLRPNEFRWETAVDFAIGSITAADVASAFNAMLAAPENHTPADVRNAERRLFPSTAAALSRAIVIDSMDVAPGPQQTTLVYLRLALTTDRLRAVYPSFANYLAKYSRKSHSRFLLQDGAGHVYFDVAGGDDRWIIRYRLGRSGLVSSLGIPHPMPDSLELTSDVTLRTKLFTVGVKHLVTSFIIDSSAHQRGWTIVAQRDPQWVLPFLTEDLIGSSLRRPFQGAGAMFELAVRDSSHGMTMLVRRGRLDVQEGTVMRILNGLVAKMFNDIDANVEREEAAFLRDMLVAFRRDALALPFQKKGSAAGQ